MPRIRILARAYFVRFVLLISPINPTIPNPTIATVPGLGNRINGRIESEEFLRTRSRTCRSAYKSRRH